MTPANLEDLIKAIQDAKKEHRPKLIYRCQVTAPSPLGKGAVTGHSR